MVTPMSEFFDSLQQGLREAIAYSENGVSEAQVHRFPAVEIKQIRTEMSLTQRQFATLCGVSLTTLQHWERGDRTPHGPALILLHLMKQQPQLLLTTLQQ